MPMVGGKKFPYTEKGKADANKASKMTGKSMMDGDKKKAPFYGDKGPSASRSNLPAKVGDTGTKSNLPVAKGAAAKKQALRNYGKKK